MIFLIFIATTVLLWHSFYNMMERYVNHDKPIWFYLYFCFFFFYTFFMPFLAVDNILPKGDPDWNRGISITIIVITWICVFYYSRHLKERD